MSRLVKDFRWSIIAGRLGRDAVPGTPSRPSYRVTTTYMVDDPDYVPSMPKTVTAELYDATDLKRTGNIRIATFEEVARIEGMAVLAANIRDGMDPQEIQWTIAVKSIIDREKKSGILGRPLVLLPYENYNFSARPYLAVWSMGQGCGIYRFDGYPTASRPTMTINPGDRL